MHPDWTAALEAVSADIHGWYQVRLGQAITGYTTPDDVLLAWLGDGENGKNHSHGGHYEDAGSLRRAGLGQKYSWEIRKRTAPSAWHYELRDSLW
jgi:hypothetical protein